MLVLLLIAVSQIPITFSNSIEPSSGTSSNTLPPPPSIVTELTASRTTVDFTNEDVLNGYSPCAEHPPSEKVRSKFHVMWIDRLLCKQRITNRDVLKKPTKELARKDQPRRKVHVAKSSFLESIISEIGQNATQEFNRTKREITHHFNETPTKAPQTTTPEPKHTEEGEEQSVTVESAAATAESTPSEGKSAANSFAAIGLIVVQLPFLSILIQQTGLIV